MIIPIHRDYIFHFSLIVVMEVFSREKWGSIFFLKIANALLKQL